MIFAWISKDSVDWLKTNLYNTHDTLVSVNNNDR